MQISSSPPEPIIDTRLKPPWPPDHSTNLFLFHPLLTVAPAFQSSLSVLDSFYLFHLHYFSPAPATLGHHQLSPQQINHILPCPCCLLRSTFLASYFFIDSHDSPLTFTSSRVVCGRVPEVQYSKIFTDLAHCSPFNPGVQSNSEAGPTTSSPIVSCVPQFPFGCVPQQSFLHSISTQTSHSFPPCPLFGVLGSGFAHSETTCRS